MAIAKRGELETKIAALRSLARALDRLIELCRDDAAALGACQMLGALETALGDASPQRPAADRPQPAPSQVAVRAR